MFKINKLFVKMMPFAESKMLIAIIVIYILLGKNSFANVPQILLMADDKAFIANIEKGVVNGLVSGSQVLISKELKNALTFKYVPFNRSFVILDNISRASCVTYKLKTPERALKYSFSLPTHLLLNQKLYQHSKLAHLSPDLLNDESNLKSLVQLFSKHSNEKLIVISNSQYGQTIDTQLSELQAKNLFKRSTANSHGKTSDWFFSGRANYAIMFPGEVFEHKLSDPNVSYNSYGVANTETAVYGHFMCNKHPDSLLFLQTVNTAIKSMQAKDAFVKLHLKYNNEQDYPIVLEEVNKLKAMNNVSAELSPSVLEKDSLVELN